MGKTKTETKAGMNGKFGLAYNIDIPAEIFQDRNVAVLERLSEYLKDKLNLNYHEIAVLLNRDERTIWTCYNRAKKKRKDE
jgi:hypothetical protein